MPNPNGGPMPDKYHLSKGSHATPQDGLCAMEWAAYIAGEPHTDQPECVSPLLRSFCIELNDRWDAEMRQRLRPYLARCIGTADDGMDRVRGFMCLDWQIRTFLPVWLELAGLTEEAARVRALDPITNMTSARAAGPVVREARKTAATACDAAWAAACDAACDAAWAAAWAAARDAAWDAAWAAACDAAWAAARDAARDAAWDAARDAARDVLAPTVRELQESALGLLDRMLPTVMVDVPADVARRAAEVCEAT